MWCFLIGSFFLGTSHFPLTLASLSHRTGSWTQKGQEGIIVRFRGNEPGVVLQARWSKLEGERTGPLFRFSFSWIFCTLLSLWRFIINSRNWNTEKAEEATNTTLGLFLPLLCKGISSQFHMPHSLAWSTSAWPPLVTSLYHELFNLLRPWLVAKDSGFSHLLVTTCYTEDTANSTIYGKNG